MNKYAVDANKVFPFDKAFPPKYRNIADYAQSL